MIFNSGAVDEIHRFSKGCPRLINIVCDLALVNGYANEAHRIQLEDIQACAQNLNVHNDYQAAISI